MLQRTQIKSILVENVRGISSLTLVFDTPEMWGNKLHLLVAPNGFGKSSVAAAFSHLRPRSFSIPPDLCHKGDESRKPKIEMTCSFGGVVEVLVAEQSRNDIAKKFSVLVINSRLKPRAIAQSGRHPFAKPIATLVVAPVVLVEKIPRKPEKSFSTSQFKGRFGAAGKVLPSMQSLLENALVVSAILALPSIKRVAQKSFWKKLDPILDEISFCGGTSAQIQSWIADNKLVAISAISELNDIVGCLPEGAGMNEVDRALIAIQFAMAYLEDGRALEDHCAWRLYLGGKKRCQDLLASVNSNPEWIGVSVKEAKGQLLVEFPSASRMSNGQRDLLSFVAQLMRADFELVGARSILIVDELFDYLDDCNLLAAQFYVSRFIEQCKAAGSEIFPLFLTHLDPEVFRHSALGLGRKELRKVHFLDRATDVSRTTGIAAMVRKRDEPDLRPFIGKFFFHYHPQDCDQVALFRSKGLRERWGKSHDFYRYVAAEFEKYLNGSADTDYVAACVAARLAIEKAAFDQLNHEDQIRFTEDKVKGTVEKLDFVESVGGRVPEAHRLLGLLYNDMLHHKEQFDYISSIISKMKNPAIRGMMREIVSQKALAL